MNRIQTVDFFFNIETDFPDSITHYVVIQTKTNIRYILIIFPLDFCLYYYYNVKLGLLLRT